MKGIKSHLVILIASEFKRHAPGVPSEKVVNGAKIVRVGEIYWRDSGNPGAEGALGDFAREPQRILRRSLNEGRTRAALLEEPLGTLIAVYVLFAKA